MLHYSIKLSQCKTRLVIDFNRFSNIIFCNCCLKMFLQIFFETNHFISPENKRILSLCIRKFHKVSFFKFSHVLIHFFLSVTGSLPNNYIGKIKERTFVSSRKSVTGFDQRTEVLRQFLFCFCDGLIRSRAKAYTGCSHCHSKLLRKISTIRTYYRHPFIF